MQLFVCKRSAHRRALGFTLLELLIALAVTALVVALTFSAMGLMGRTDERSQQVVQRAQRIQATHQWLQKKLMGLRTLSLQAEGSGGQFVLFFNGNAAGAFWAAPLPERGVGGGLHAIRVSPVSPDSGAVDVMVEVLPFNGGVMRLEWEKAEREVLVRGVTHLQWFYQDGATGQWVQDWPSSKPYFPARIRIELGDALGRWPSLVVALPRAR